MYNIIHIYKKCKILYTFVKSVKYCTHLFCLSCKFYIISDDAKNRQ